MLGRVTKKESIHEQELDDKELMLHDVHTDSIHILNETAKAVWHLADGKHTLEEIENEIKEMFCTGTSEDIQGDIEKISNEFLVKGIINN